MTGLATDGYVFGMDAVKAATNFQIIFVAGIDVAFAQLGSQDTSAFQLGGRSLLGNGGGERKQHGCEQDK
jgi:hypothetical protein